MLVQDLALFWVLLNDLEQFFHLLEDLLGAFLFVATVGLPVVLHMLVVVFVAAAPGGFFGGGSCAAAASDVSEWINQEDSGSATATAFGFIVSTAAAFASIDVKHGRTTTSLPTALCVGRFFGGLKPCWGTFNSH